MKKFLVSFTLFVLIAGVLLYNYLLNRYNADWEIKTVQPKLLSKSKIENNIQEVSFLNDIYKNYENFYSKKEYFTKEYNIDLSTISVVKGNVKKSKNKLEARGDEIIIGIRGIVSLFKKENVDFLRMIIDSDKDIQVKVFEVFKKVSPWKKYRDIDPGFLIHRLSKFSFMAKVPGKGGKQKLDIELANYFVKGGKRANGLVLKIKSQKEEEFKLKIEEMSLKSYNNKIDESFPAVGYFKHGKTWLKSLFLPVNCSISYLVKAKEKFFFSGYLGAFPGETLAYDIEANGKPIVSQQVTSGMTYFCQEVIPSNQNGKVLFKIAVKARGKDNGAGVLGNFTFFYKKKEGENSNFVFYLIDALRSDYGGIDKEPSRNAAISTSFFNDKTPGGHRENKKNTFHNKLFENYFKDGAVFKNAYANAAWTADSLAVIFSGKYKFSLVDDQIYHPNLLDEEFLLTEYLKRKGYTTAAFITNSFLVKNNSYQGFDFVYQCWKDKKKSELFPTYKEYIDFKYGDMERFIKEFTSRNKYKKLFIYIHTIEPHDPYELPMKMRHYSKGKDTGLLKSVYGKFKIFLRNPTSEQIDTLKSLYKDNVLAAYDFFEKTSKLLEQDSILGANSLYLLTADHGERFFEHGSWVHGRPDVYNEVLRIPFMIKGAGIKPGYYYENVQLADIYPTIMAWSGDQKSKEMVGDSLLKYINGSAGYFKNRIIYSDGTKHPFQYCYIIGNIKIIIEGDKNQVYDLAEDPGETKNLAAEKRFAEMIKKARQFREKFKKSYTKKKSALSAEELERLKSLGYLE